MTLPSLVVTGASGFIGRHLLDFLKEDYRIYALARRSQIRCGAPFHENIIWHQVDIGYAEGLHEVFKEIQADGGADLVLHLAAHYDFSGEDDPEYYRTNVEGLRHVLESSKLIRPKRFFFSSSVAACDFPPSGKVLNEDSPPDGDHVYAQTKAIGEAMLAEYSSEYPSTIIRFAALFSDWCEYPPLYMFLRTWLSRAWNNRILGGRGESAIPYLHIKDGVSFLSRALARHAIFDEREILIASPDGATSHNELYEIATNYENEKSRRPLHMPKVMVLPGIHVRNLAGRLMRDDPFEKPWMAKYVDLKLAVDASRTRQRLDWKPRDRLDVLFRMPFLIENMKYDRVDWTRRNRDAMKQVRIRPNLKIHSLLLKHKMAIGSTFKEVVRYTYDGYREMEEKELDWAYRVIFRNLCNAVRLRVKADFMSYCRELADRRREQGISGEELIGALELLNGACLEVLRKDPEIEDVIQFVPAYLTMTVRFGIDQVKDRMDEVKQQNSHQPAGKEFPDTA